MKQITKHFDTLKKAANYRNRLYSKYDKEILFIYNEILNLKQKDIAAMFRISQSALSKLISKNFSYGRKSDSDSN